MKKIILSTIMFLSIIAINAQSVVSITDQDFGFSTGSKECIKVAFKDVSAKNVDAAFKEYFKKNYKAKVVAVKKTAGELEVEQFKATDIQQRPTTVTAVITELEGSAILYLHYKSDGYVVSEKNTPEIYTSYKRMTQSIANDAIVLAYADVIVQKEKELADQEKTLDVMVKDTEKEKTTVVKLESENKTAEAEVSKYTAALNAQKAIIISKAQLVKDKELEIANFDVKSLERDIKSIEGDNKNVDKEIAKLNADIAKKTAEIAKIQAEIKTIEVKIETENQKKGVNNEKIAGIQSTISSHNEAGLKEQLKILQKDSKDADAEEKNIVKSLEKENAAITKNNVAIKESQLKIATLKTTEDAKKAEVDAIREALKTIQTKVSSLNR